MQGGRLSIIMVIYIMLIISVFIKNIENKVKHLKLFIHITLKWDIRIRKISFFSLNAKAR